jgi:hypothetical protein
MVWGVLSRFVHVTTVPTFTISGEGSNAKFLIVMTFPPPVAVEGAGTGAAGEEVQPAAMHAKIIRRIQDIPDTIRTCDDILP